MLTAAKLYLFGLLGFTEKVKNASGKKKPPARKRNKHLRRKRPGVFSSIFEFLSQRIGWKGVALAFGVLLCIFMGILALAYYFSPIDPLPVTDFTVLEPEWGVPPYEDSDVLTRAKRIRSVQKLWPIAIEADRRDNLYVATYNGIILKIECNDNGLMGEGKLEIIRQGPVENVTLPDELMGTYGGHPVGLRYIEGTGLLFVLDSLFGLFAVSTQTKVATPLLPISFNGTGILTPTSFAMHDKTTDIYITDFSTKWSDYYYMNQMLEGSCTGRLWRYDFATNELEAMIENLCAPVGVEVTANSTMLLITEALKPRIRVVQLNTTSSIRYHPLPGFPGKPRINPRGGVWLPMTIINKGFFDMVYPWPWLRKLLCGLFPQGYLKSLASERTTLVAEVDPMGVIADTIQDMREKKIYDVIEVKEGTRGQLIFASPSIEHLSKLVDENNEKENKKPVAPEFEEDEVTKAIRQHNEELEKEKDLIFNPEPDGNVDMKLIGEEEQSFADDPKELMKGWYAKPPSFDNQGNNKPSEEL